MNYQITSPQTPAQWNDYYALRWRILRAPWGQALGSERDEHEDLAWHAMAVADDNRILGVGRLHKLDTQRVQIRYMAVAEDARGQGIGSAILAALEAKACAWQARYIVLNARKNVEYFYLARQYYTLADGETLFGAIPHVIMQKDLQNSR